MSNKTPVVKNEKTESAPKQLRWFLPVTFLAVIILVVMAMALFAGREESGRSRQTLKFGDRTLAVEEVVTDEDRRRGLSGRESIDQNYGMLFIFENNGRYCFWMKDMNFPIDILWLDGDYTVVDIKHSVSPDTYPKSFCPDTQARYVLEVQAGLSAAKNIAVGSKL